MPWLPPSSACRLAPPNSASFTTRGRADGHLHKAATTRDLDISEAYWTYWYWYEQITGGDIVSTPAANGGVQQGGLWGIAAELIYRYGWMHEGDFIPEADGNAKRHKEAVAYIDQALTVGALASPASRRDPRLVRQELDKAWKLGTNVVEDMGALFPIVGSLPPPDPSALPASPAHLVGVTERAASASLGPTIHAPQEMKVLAADGVSQVTLADIVGRRAPGTRLGTGKRIGDEAWSEVFYAWRNGEEGRRRAILKNVQHALNRRLAVPIAWLVSSDPSNGEYSELTSPTSIRGGHESLVVDYAVSSVPGFGDLHVDVQETRPEALEAALDDRAVVTLLRIKNSWGADPSWTEEARRQLGGDAVSNPSFLPSKPGFNDLHLGYLDAQDPHGAEDQHLAMSFALPNKLRFALPPRAPHDTCLDPTPIDPTRFPFKRPGVTPGACTAAEVTALGKYYETNVADSASIANWSASVSAGCASCVFGDGAGATWTPIVTKGDQLEKVNRGGCIAIKSGSETCGRAYHQLGECKNAACGSLCQTVDDAARCFGDETLLHGPCELALEAVVTECGEHFGRYEATCKGSFAFEGLIKAQCVDGR